MGANRSVTHVHTHVRAHTRKASTSQIHQATSRALSCVSHIVRNEEQKLANVHIFLATIYRETFQAFHAAFRRWPRVSLTNNRRTELNNMQAHGVVQQEQAVVDMWTLALGHVIV